MFLPFAIVSSVLAQSHPSWWTYASPEATALVGIDWQNIRSSPFADAVDAELWGDLEFPDLPCLRSARQIIVSSPELLAMATGVFNAVKVRQDALNKGFKPATYRGMELWIAPGASAPSLARLNDQLVLIGSAKTLRDALDKSAMDMNKSYSPLLARGARFGQKDLWVVASQLPDPLASNFVPLEQFLKDGARCFEGSLSLRDGLDLEASLCAGSETSAQEVAEKLQRAVPALPAIARGLEISVEEKTVQLALTVSRDQVVASLHQRSAQTTPPAEVVKVGTPQHTETIAVEKPAEKSVAKTIGPTPQPVMSQPALPQPALSQPALPQPALPQPVQSQPAPPAAAPQPVEIKKSEPEKPQVIRILGLDDGPREVILTPAKKP